jgi:hypothetical protein
MLSAPMIDAVGERLQLTPERKVSVNLAFRHTVFMVIPYCATIVLIASMSPPFPMWQYLTVGFCFMCVTFASGYVLFLRTAPNAINAFDKKDRMPAIRGLIAGLTPVILVIFFNNIAGFPSAVSVVFSIIITGVLHRRKGMLRHIKDGFAFETVLMMCGIYFHTKHHRRHGFTYCDVCKCFDAQWWPGSCFFTVHHMLFHGFCNGNEPCSNEYCFANHHGVADALRAHHVPDFYCHVVVIFWLLLSTAASVPFVEHEKHTV